MNAKLPCHLKIRLYNLSYPPQRSGVSVHALTTSIIY